jgi:hypothetical protein
MVLMKISRPALIVFSAQLLVFALFEAFSVGIPAWAEIPYTPFQWAFVHLAPAAYWSIGLALGVVVGMAFYAFAAAILFRALSSWLPGRRH